MKNNKANFIPLLTDISLLFVVFFIAVIILQQIILQETEVIFDIEADRTYFEAGKDSLREEQKEELKNILLKINNFEENIINKFNSNNLEQIIVTGYSDTVQPSAGDLKNKNWRNNRELSFFRANTICDLFIELAKDSFNFNEEKIIKFKSIVLPAGYGEFNPLSTCECNVDDCEEICRGKDIIKEKVFDEEGEFVYRINGDSEIKWGWGKEEDFIDWERTKNRRIEVKTIYK